MNEKKLKNIAKISLGHSFRQAIREDFDVDVFVVEARNIKEGFNLSTKNLFKIKLTVGQDKILQKGDVLLSNRTYFKTSVFNESQKVIPASSVYILRANKEIIIPEFLAIWLNSKKGQNEILKNTTGSAVKTILKKDLENLKIEIPKLEKQKIIVELFKNKIELKDKLEKKKKIIENIFQGALTTIN